ncbi:MAG: rhodanese-like domain-containing protein [Bacteroidota bacterium]
MKKVFLPALLLLALAIQSCNNNSTQSEIEMISPIDVYEAVYGEDSLQLVDVRTAEEYEVSHLKNAQNICVTSDDFKEKVATLDKQKPVYVYCKKGGRSAEAASILKEMGFTKVYDLQGGITSWQQEGLETVN